MNRISQGSEVLWIFGLLSRIAELVALTLDWQRLCSAIHFSFPQSEVFHVSSLEEKVNHSQ